MIYDISLTLSSNLVSWPGEDAFQLSKIHAISNGDVCNVTELHMSTHQGTHIDSPYHFINNGAKSEDLLVENLIGPCVVIDVEESDIINKTHVDNYDYNKYKRVIFKTKNSILWKNKIKEFDKNFVSLSLEAAQYLYEQGVILIGIDYLSIEEFSSSTHDVHKLLLNNRIVILEGLDLSDVCEGYYELICLPIRLAGSDGSPARAVLRGLV
jgi:arylformamidase